MTKLKPRFHGLKAGAQKGSDAMTTIPVRLLLATILLLAAGDHAVEAGVVPDPLDLWVKGDSGTTTDLYGLVYGQGMFVAVGYSGVILTSPDGVAWANQSSGTSNDLHGATYANNMFLAVGNSGTILTSPDGIAWTSHPSGTTEYLKEVSYGNGIYLAAGKNGTILSSPDGLVWTPQSSGTLQDFSDVAFANGIFVAIGGGPGVDSIILTSADGTAWKSAASGTRANLRRVAYGRGTFVAVGNNPTILTSPDGVVWTNASFPSACSAPYSSLRGINYANGIFVAVGNNGTLLTSPDAVLWSCQNSGTDKNLHSVSQGDGRFVVVGSDGTVLLNNSSPFAVMSIRGDATVVEGNSGTTNAVFTVSLVTNHTNDGETFSVDFTTTDATATAGSDYLATNGTFIFHLGETRKTIIVPVLGDTLNEADEMFFVRLSNPSNCSLIKAEAIGTILDDDTGRFYVNVSNPNPVPPYTNWATAATSIQDAIDTAFAGDEIVVTNGVYMTGGRVVYGAVTTRVAVIKPLTVRSVNGPGMTIIQGNGGRCAYLTTNAALMGFTLTNGITGTYENGGGVVCDSASALVSNCILAGNWADNEGGGAFQGTLNQCTLVGNSAAYGGGGASGGFSGCTLNNCTLVGNRAAYGGGAFFSALNNCTLTGNSALTDGGAAEGGRLNNCILTGNSAAGVGNETSGSELNYCYAGDPMFLDQAAGNLRLASNSPCINAGNNTYAPVGLDLDGNSRIEGGTVDIGAYEIQSPQSLISYAWLHEYGLAINEATDGADPDGDGASNYQEWRAGTDPTNALSVLRLLAPTRVGSDLAVSWESVPGHSYFLDWSTNLMMRAGFHPLATNLSATGNTTTFTHPGAAGFGPRFYRVGVE